MWLPPPLPRKFDACVRDFESKKPDVRASAATDIVRHARDPNDSEHRATALKLLEGALADPAPVVRSAAAVALSDLGSNGAVKALLRLIDDDDQHVRQMAIVAVGELADADEAIVTRLEKAQKDRRPEMRYQSVIALSKLLQRKKSASTRDSRVAALLRATSDDDMNVRYIGLRLAEDGLVAKAVVDTEAGEEESDADETDPSPVDGRLLTRARALLDDEADDVVVAAAIFLAKAGDARGRKVVHAVVAGTRRAQLEDEREAVELSGAIGLREAIPALERRAFGVLRHVRDTCSFHALIALASLGHERAKRAIEADLASRRRTTREGAVVAAGRARLVELRARIEAFADADVDGELRRVALAELES